VASAPPGQTWPHALQLLLSEAVFVHAFPQHATMPASPASSPAQSATVLQPGAHANSPPEGTQIVPSGHVLLPGRHGTQTIEAVSQTEFGAAHSALEEQPG
jgi:hypothetical protein